MYSGQFEIRSVPLAGAAVLRCRGRRTAAVRLATGGQEGRAEDQRRRSGGTAADEASAGCAVGRESGSKLGIDS